MTARNYSLGPYRYVRTNGSPTTGLHMIAGSEPGYIAEVRDCGSGDVVANAQLFAAAWDMMRALQKIVDDIDPRAASPWKEVRSTADAALRKAGMGTPHLRTEPASPGNPS